MEFGLKGKTALVTGAARGIGLEIAAVLVREGARVALADLEAPERAARELGNGCIAVSMDVSDEESVKAAFGLVEKAWGKLDILVNNAGITRDAIAKGMTTEAFRTVLDVNLVGVFLCCREALPLLRATGGGAVVNLSSVSAYNGNPGQANYTASKLGVVGLSRTLAMEFSRYHIRVNAVAPGFILTDMTLALPEETRAAIVSRVPLGRAGTPKDIADAVAFLASDCASLITGQVLHVNGGIYLS